MLRDARETDSMKPNNMTYFRHNSPGIRDQLKLPTIVAKQIANRNRPDVTRIYRQSTIMSRPTFPIRKARDCVATVSIF